jgi:hypothetical protein
VTFLYRILAKSALSISHATHNPSAPMYCHGRLGGGGRLTVGSVGNSIPMGIELDYREKKMKTVYSSIGCNNRRQKAYCGKCIIVIEFL